MLQLHQLAFHEIFYYQFPEIFSRNYSGKVPLFFRKFPEKFHRKFPEISELPTLSVPVFSINDVALPVCNSVKDLGITVNGTLAPCDHIAQITS